MAGGARQGIESSARHSFCCVLQCDGSTKLVGLRRTQTVGCLKIALEEQEGIPVVDQCLVHNGKELSNKKRLADECQVAPIGSYMRPG